MLLTFFGATSPEPPHLGHLASPPLILPIPAHLEHTFVDDATGKITGLYMYKNECLLGYLEVLRQTLENYGIPISLYTDKYSVFFPPKKVDDHITIEEQLNGRES